MMVVDDAEDMKIISQHFRYDGDCSSIADITINTSSTFEIFHHTTLRNHHQKNHCIFS